MIDVRNTFPSSTVMDGLSCNLKTSSKTAHEEFNGKLRQMILADAYMKRIVAATVGPMPRPMPVGMSDPTPKVIVAFENGEVKELFSFYPDEISFSESEFIGLTEEEARALRCEKDIAYLRS